MENVIEVVGNTLTPALLEVATVALMSLIGWVLLVVKKKTGLDIEQKHRDALHKALMTGVKSAVEGFQSGASPREIVAAAVAHAQKSVPDALNALKPGVDVLTNIALSKLEDVLTSKDPAATPK